MPFNKTTNITMYPHRLYLTNPQDLMRTQMENCHLSERLYHEEEYCHEQRARHKRILRNAKTRVREEGKREGIEEGKKAGFQEALELQGLFTQGVNLGREQPGNEGAGSIAGPKSPLMIEGAKVPSQAGRRSLAAPSAAPAPQSNVSRFLAAQGSQVSRSPKAPSAAPPPPQSNVARFLAAQTQGSQVSRSSHRTVRPAPPAGSHHSSRAPGRSQPAQHLGSVSPDLAVYLLSHLLTLPLGMVISRKLAMVDLAHRSGGVSPSTLIVVFVWG